MLEFTGTPSQVTQWLFEQDRDKVFTVKERKRKRSLTQNAYYWALNDKLASVLRMGRDELHFQMLRSYAPCEVVSLLENVPLGDYFDYYEVFAKGYLNGKTYNHVRVYKNSSRMDSAEFARLLDGTIRECEQQGIQTLTPAEVANLKYIEPKEE
jgi:hypothetical protein